MKRILMTHTCYNFGCSNIPWSQTTRFHEGDIYDIDDDSADYYLKNNWAVMVELPEVK